MPNPVKKTAPLTATQKEVRGMRQALEKKRGWGEGEKTRTDEVSHQERRGAQRNLMTQTDRRQKDIRSYFAGTGSSSMASARVVEGGNERNDNLGRLAHAGTGTRGIHSSNNVSTKGQHTHNKHRIRGASGMTLEHTRPVGDSSVDRIRNRQGTGHRQTRLDKVGGNGEGGHAVVGATVTDRRTDGGQDHIVGKEEASQNTRRVRDNEGERDWPEQGGLHTRIESEWSGRRQNTHRYRAAGQDNRIPYMNREKDMGNRQYDDHRIVRPWDRMVRREGGTVHSWQTQPYDYTKTIEDTRETEQQRRSQRQVEENKWGTPKRSHGRIVGRQRWEEEITQAIQRQGGGQEGFSGIMDRGLRVGNEKHIQVEWEEGFEAEQLQGVERRPERHTIWDSQDNERSDDGQRGKRGDDRDRRRGKIEKGVQWWDVH